MRSTIIAMTFFQITAASLLYAQEKPSNQETVKAKRAAVVAKISDGKRTENPSDMDKARMEAALRFAETVLKYGRDTYGEKHTPLFTDVLDVDTMKAPEKIYICHLCGNPCPRQDQPWQPVVSSNLAYQGNLMRFLAGLSNLTGDSKYKEAYQDSIRYYFKHYQTLSGVLSMGHHRFIDLKADDYDGDNWPPGDRGHEMKGDIPYYDLFWETDPKATHEMLTGHWSSHIKNWVTMDFTRHGNFNKPLDEGVWDRPVAEPVKGIVKGDLTFFNSASDIVWAGGKLSELAEDDRPRIWAQRLLARYIDSAHPDTRIPPCHHTFVRDFGEEGKSWPEYAMLFSDELFASGATMLMRLGDLLGDRGAYFRDSVHRYLKAYVKHAYNPEDNTLRNILYDGTDLSVYDLKDGVSRGWIWKAHSGYMVSFALCYRQTRDREVWGTLRAMARGNDLGDIGEAGGEGPTLNLATHQCDPGLIFALVEIFRATDNRVYLDLARVIGNNALRQKFNAERGLFVASNLEKIADLNASEPLAFITLEAALRGKLHSVPTYDGSVATSPSGGVLRPSRVLPYHPTASHCWYLDTVLALCDELVPDGSNDSRIPRMSWYRISRLDGPRGTAVATFPSILTGPVTVTDVADSANARNRLGGIIIDSPFSYTFGPSGCLQMSEDFTITVIQGNHTMQAVNWQPMGAIDYVLDVAAGGRFTFAGVIYEYPGHRPENVAGLVKNGDGTAVVTGDYGPRYSANLRDNRAYRGETVINKGVLLVNNATGSGISPRSAVQVKDGGTLGGHGAIGNGGTSAIVNVHAGGTIAPGSNAGTLTVRDGLTLYDGAKLACELGKSGDLLKVTGGTFTGSGKGGVSVSVADADAIEMNKTYDLIDWTGATPSGVDVEDFVVDQASEYSGTFHMSGSRLQIQITGLTAPSTAETTAPAETTTPKSTTPKPITANTAVKTLAAHTWTSPDGGSWADHANWHDGVIPNGTAKEWVQYSFEKPCQVSSVEVYWLDDNGANRVPESWRVLYHHAGAWTPADAAGEYGVAKDRFNRVKFKPVVTDRLRLEVKLQPGLFGGILEWRVDP